MYNKEIKDVKIKFLGKGMSQDPGINVYEIVIAGNFEKCEMSRNEGIFDDIISFYEETDDDNFLPVKMFSTYIKVGYSDIKYNFFQSFYKTDKENEFFGYIRLLEDDMVNVFQESKETVYIKVTLLDESIIFSNLYMNYYADKKLLEEMAEGTKTYQ